MDSSIDLRRLASLITDIKFTMFSTVNADGSIISRPMANQEIVPGSFEGTLWFFTKKDTAKVHSIEHDSHVNLAYANPEKQQYVSISGKAFISEDKEKMKDLWTHQLKSWFPEGLEDPEMTLIGVDIQSAEVWDSPTVKAQSEGFSKAASQPSSPSKHLEINRHH
ncbi:MAG TPA: pyridoxamine 5'-phosphate oxidase family protein [Bacteriovoracaceae bacterium]|nr:pyridoxamine 5'-phosphate oxidase family protein [Bacteriovoracaceae bacterium]